MTVYLVRHGETTWNVEGRVQGWAGAPLSGRGREQARATGERLTEADVDRLVVSDLQRTRETARLLGESRIDVPTEYDDGWRERDFGEFQGLDRETVADRHPAFTPEQSLTVVDDVPGGETLAEFRRRVGTAWEAVRAELEDETVAVVTHGGPIRAVVAEMTGRDLSALGREWSPGNCCVTQIDPVDGRVVRRDECAHL